MIATLLALGAVFSKKEELYTDYNYEENMTEYEKKREVIIPRSGQYWRVIEGKKSSSVHMIFDFENMRFNFFLPSFLSSFINRGSLEINDNMVICTNTDDRHYYFEIVDEETLIFKEESDELRIEITPVEYGDELKWFAEDE